MTERRAQEHVCFIIHGHRPYCFDINEALALPSGFRFRNRFDFQWIDPELREEVSSLQDDRVLLVLRDPHNNTLIPVRWGKIVTVQTVGKVVNFEYILGDLIQYATEPNVRQQEIISITKAFATRHSWLPGTQGEGLKDPSVFRSTVGLALPVANPDDLTENLTAWGNAVSAVATAPIFSKIEFLKIVGLFDSDGSPAPVIDESLLIRPGTVYNLRVFQQVPEPPDVTVPTHMIEVNTFANHVVALRHSQPAVGKYDMLNFVLRVLPLSPGERTAIEIPHVPDAATDGQARTTLYLPMTVQSPKRSRLALILSILAVSIFFMFRPEILDLPHDAIRNVATLLFVITLTGPSRALETLWPHWPWGTGK